MSSFHFWRNEIHLKLCKTKLFTSKNETYGVHDELPGELFEGGSYFFEASAERESYSRGGGGGWGGGIQGNKVNWNAILYSCECSSWPDTVGPFSEHYQYQVSRDVVGGGPFAL